MTLVAADRLVSVVIPFYYTYAPYLADCLRSVRQQTYPHWEVVVVDDASPTDEAERIAADCDDPRIRVIRHDENRGQAAARNSGMRAAAGRLLVAVDCDDVLAPTHLECLTDALGSASHCCVAYSDYQLFAGASDVLQFPVQDTRALLLEQWLPHPGTLVRRSVWERTGGYCEDPVFRAGNEDWDYWLSIAEIGLSAVRVPQPLYFYRHHQGSITSRQFACNDYLMREAMYARHRALFESWGEGERFLSGGYRTSGSAFLKRGQPRKGLELLAKAAWLSPADFASASWRRARRAATQLG